MEFRNDIEILGQINEKDYQAAHFLQKIGDDKESVVFIEIRADLSDMDNYNVLRDRFRDYVVQHHIDRFVITLTNQAALSDSFVGLLVKLIFGYNIKVELKTESESLYSLLDKLDLKVLLNVRKI